MTSSFGPRRRETITFRDAAIIYRNLTGEKRQYNTEGDRNFSIMLGELEAAELERAGWNVKPMKRREEDDQQLYHLKIKVNYEGRAPQVWLITSGGRTLLTPDIVGMIDHLEYARVDLVIAPYDWAMNGNTGRSAYLQSLYFTVFEDELALEYASVPQIGAISTEMPRELEPGARLAYDYEGEVVEEV